MFIDSTETTKVWYVRTLEKPVRKVINRGCEIKDHYGPTYKVVRWISGKTDRWTVYAAQGKHEYSRYVDESSPVHQRVVAEVKRLTEGGE